MNFFKQLRCSKCNLIYPGDKPINLCQCNAPLLAEYDLQAARIIDKDEIKKNYKSIWDLAPILPVHNKENRFTLCEGNTPLLRVKRLGDFLGHLHQRGRLESHWLI